MKTDSPMKILIGTLLCSLTLFSYSSESVADCDPAKGLKVFAKCQSCHTLDTSGTHLAGPNLHGILGRNAASTEGYQFSRGLRKSNLVWDTQTLHQFLESPQKIVPRTKMAFAGLKQVEDRNAVICHIRDMSK